MRSRAVSLPASRWRRQPLLAAAQLGAPLELGKAFEQSVHRASAVTTRSVSGRPRRLRLLPVLQELLEADVGERMLEALLDHRGGHVTMSAPIRAASMM